jgi:hypothetical protein
MQELARPAEALATDRVPINQASRFQRWEAPVALCFAHGLARLRRASPSSALNLRPDPFDVELKASATESEAGPPSVLVLAMAVALAGPLDARLVPGAVGNRDLTPAFAEVRTHVLVARLRART